MKATSRNSIYSFQFDSKCGRKAWTWSSLKRGWQPSGSKSLNAHRTKAITDPPRHCHQNAALGRSTLIIDIKSREEEYNAKEGSAIPNKERYFKSPAPALPVPRPAEEVIERPLLIPALPQPQTRAQPLIPAQSQRRPSPLLTLIPVQENPTRGRAQKTIEAAVGPQQRKIKTAQPHPKVIGNENGRRQEQNQTDE